MTRILLVENHRGVRLLIKEFLMREKDFFVVAEAEDGSTGLQLAQELQPDFLVTDLNIPKLHGLSLIALARKSCPQTRIVAISIHSDLAYVTQVKFNGAVAFILKDMIVEELVPALRAAKLPTKRPLPRKSKNPAQGRKNL